MIADGDPWPVFTEPRTQEPMKTLHCPHCKEALYMTEKALKMPSWKCPACGKTTRT